MAAYFDGSGWQPAAFLAPRIASFTDFLASNSPGLLPGPRGLSLPTVAGGSDVIKDLPARHDDRRGHLRRWRRARRATAARPAGT